MEKCYNCDADIDWVDSVCPRCGVVLQGSNEDYVEYHGSFLLGFVLGMFFGGFTVWFILLFVGRKRTRRGAFWSMIVYFLVFFFGIIYLNIMLNL